MMMSAELKTEGESLLPLFQKNADELFGVLIPHLMARLPDWPQIEAKSREGAASASSSASTTSSATPGAPAR